MGMGEMLGGSYNCKAETRSRGSIRACSHSPILARGGPKRVIGQATASPPSPLAKAGKVRIPERVAVGRE